MISYEVRIVCPDSQCSEWSAVLVDANANCELYSASGGDWNTAIVELVYAMAAELEERAKHLPDDYVDLADRQDQGAGQAHPIGVAGEAIKAGQFVAVTPGGTVVVAQPPTGLAYAYAEFGVNEPLATDNWPERDPSRKCKRCGCTDADCSRCVAKTGRPCSWAADDLCSACVEPHYFDTNPLNGRCAACGAPPAIGDQVCQIPAGRLLTDPKVLIETGRHHQRTVLDS